MSIDTVSATGGTAYPPLDRAASVTPVSATSSAGTETSTNPPAEPKQPFLLVPTIPLSPTVLAELVGRQLSLNGPVAGR
ncbi:hypothetical protein [Rhodopila sp.]|uniref:hypothetical protein n=1 Tax=Rhodopila sp. TaxID=2480087 RepID=UPI003D107763